MSHARVQQFRFGVGAGAVPSAQGWAELARRVEDLGYATLGTGDHFTPGQFAPVPALMAAAAATRRLRLAPLFDNDFRHPALLAKEAATLDLLSEGRLEFGLGAGWLKREYDQTGIPFERGAVRVGRLTEAVAIIKALWSGAPVTFAGRYYTIHGLQGAKPFQQPHPPLFIGAGGKRLLSFAAREADRIGIIAPALPEGGVAIAEDTEANLAQRVQWVRDAAGERLDGLTLNMLIWAVEVSDNRAAAADAAARRMGLTADQVLQSPFFLVGSISAMVDRLVELRTRYGISDIRVSGPDMESFAPVVARLAGQ